MFCPFTKNDCSEDCVLFYRTKNKDYEDCALNLIAQNAVRSMRRDDYSPGNLLGSIPKPPKF